MHAWDIQPNDFSQEKTLEGKLKFLVRFGILAPSSHNAQPWRFRIGETCIDVFADFSRRLPLSDEKGRMLYTALGCAIENIRIAADHYGYATAVEYDKGLEHGLVEHVARLHVREPRQSPESLYQPALFDALPKRASYRARYRTDPLPDSITQTLKELSGDGEVSFLIIGEQQAKARIAALMGSAMKTKMTDGDFRNELAGWLRTNLSKKQDGMPGFGHEMSLPVSILAPFILRWIDVSEVEKKKAMARVRNFPATCLIVSSKDHARAWVKTGELLERLLLALHTQGMAASIMAAIIEDAPSRKSLEDLISSGHEAMRGWLPQAFFGFGFPLKSVLHSPRRPLEAVLFS